MQILVLGGDGYLGWPTALHLSAAGHDVAVDGNFARRVRWRDTSSKLHDPSGTLAKA
jgi:nucleoside-diphosphate-sugar epimerase